MRRADCRGVGFRPVTVAVGGGLAGGDSATAPPTSDGSVLTAPGDEHGTITRFISVRLPVLAAACTQIGIFMPAIHDGLRAEVGSSCAARADNVRVGRPARKMVRLPGGGV